MALHQFARNPRRRSIIDMIVAFYSKIFVGQIAPLKMNMRYYASFAKQILQVTHLVNIIVAPYFVPQLKQYVRHYVLSPCQFLPIHCRAPNQPCDPDWLATP